MDKKKVVVLYGGRSGEHQVSIVSALSVVKFLEPTKYDVLPVYITKEGKWHFPVFPQALLDNSIDLQHISEVAILPDPTKKSLFFLEGKKVLPVDIVFPVMHGTYGEDGTIQGLLELAGIPYVGAGVFSSAAGMDKVMMKKVFSYHNIPQVNFVAVWRSSIIQAEELEQTIIQIETELGYPCFVKPANLGSSVGISKVKNREQVKVALLEAAQYDRKLIVEEFVEAREIEVSVLGNEKPKTSIPGEIVPCNEFYDYNAKYIAENSKLIIPAELTEVENQLVGQLAIKAYQALDCTGLARIDFFLTKKEKRVLLNEINTLPGFTSISMYPKLWEATGINYQDLITQLLDLAEKQYQEKVSNKTDFTAT